MIRNYGINFPCEKLLVLGIGVIDDPYGKFIVDLIKGDILRKHFPADGMNRFGSSFYGIVKPFLIQRIFDYLGKIVNIVLLFSLGILNFSQNIIVYLGLGIFKAEVLQVLF